MNFTHDVRMNGDQIDISFEGFLNESSDLPVLPKPKQMNINIDRVKMINSTGILLWIKWLKNYENVPLKLDRCRPAFISAANAVKNFLTPQISVKSFYVPYVSEDGDVEDEILILVPDGTVDLSKLVPDHFTTPDGKNFEADVRLEQYLGFMKRLLAGSP